MSKSYGDPAWCEALAMGWECTGKTERLQTASQLKNNTKC